MAGRWSPNECIKHLSAFGNLSPYTPTSILRIALTTSVTLDVDAMPAGAEITEAGYARLTVTNGPGLWAIDVSAPTRPVLVSVAAVQFAAAGQPWSQVAQGWQVLRDDDVTVLGSGPLGSPSQPVLDQKVTIPAGVLRVSLPVIP